MIRPHHFLLTALLAGVLCLAAGCQRASEEPPEPDSGAAGAGEPAAAPAAARQPDAGSEPDPVTARRGLFRYLADAPRFRECATGVSVPVAMSGPYIELEQAYLNSGIEPGSELGVALQGRYLERAAADGPGRETVLVVERFDGLANLGDCAPDTAGIAGPEWALTALRGQPLAPDATPHPPTLVFDSAEMRIHGQAGCNRFFGSWEGTGGTMRLGALGATRMACAAGMDVEQAYLAALSEVDGARLAGAVLELTAGDTVVLTFRRAAATPPTPD